MDHRVYTSRAPWLVALAIVPIVFGGVFANGWVNWDDPTHVLDNPQLPPAAPWQLGDFWRRPYGRLYIPVSYMLFAAETWAGRIVSGSATPSPLVFHAVSIALHVVCVALVARLLVRLGSSEWAAAAGAALFAVHPLQVESVAWISEQRGLLAALFSLLALELLLQRAAAKPAWASASAATLAFGTALVCKPSAIVVPALALVLEAGRRPEERLPRARLAVILGMWCLLAAGTALATKRLQPVDHAVAGPVSLRPVIAGNAVAFYAEKTFWPRHLSIDYGLTPNRVLAEPVAVWKAAIVAGLVGASFVLPVSGPVRVAMFLFIVPLFPVLGLVPFVFQEISTVADRYAYLAMLGPATAIAILIDASSNRWVQGAATAALVTLAVTSMWQVPVWHDSLALNAHALAVNGGTRDTLNNLGLALLDRGRLTDAADCFERSIAYDPAYPRAHFNLALARHRVDQAKEAETQYREAIRLCPGYAAAHNNLGILLAQQGRSIEAEGHFRAALAIEPTFDEAVANLRLLETPQTGVSSE
jgi:tetratricopeptide (TPR) repeat protein